MSRRARRCCCGTAIGSRISSRISLRRLRSSTLPTSRGWSSPVGVPITPPIDRGAFTSLRPDELAGLRIALHPSVSLVGSQFPIVSIWEVHRTAQLAPIREWVPESALVARPSLDVEVWRLPAGGYVFLGSLLRGMAMAAAAECAAAATGEFDVAENLAVLLRANVVIALQ